jgi:hypothetical protein
MLITIANMQAQSPEDSAQNNVTQKTEKKYQAKPPATQPFGDDAFEPSNTTTIRWLGNAGFFINCHAANSSCFA